MADNRSQEEGVCAVVAMVDGHVVRVVDSQADPTRLRRFALAARDVFDGVGVPLEAMWRRMGVPAPAEEIQDFILISERRVHVALRSSVSSDNALLDIAPHDRKVGLVISEARRRLTALETSAEMDSDGASS